MPDLSQLITFTAMAVVLIAIPGPSVLFVIGRALAHGRRTAMLSVVGNTLGAYALAVAVSFGVGAVIARSVVVFNVLKLGGAAYLVYLGVVAWRRRRELAAAYDAPVGAARAWGLAAAAARDWFGRSERRMAMVGGAGGLAMIGLGVTVAVTGRKD